MSAERRCPVCGRDLAGHRSDARVCGSSCRRELSRLRALLAGRRDGPYDSVNEYRNRRQKRADPAPIINPKATRTSRAGEFIGERCRERSGHVTLATSIYAAYLRWSEREEPEEPLSRSAFYRLLKSRTPSGDRTLEHRGQRGRPRLAFRGVELSRPREQVSEAA
jgi:hypothetical protein